MDESLLSASNIILFGRLFPLEVGTTPPEGLGANQFLRKQLEGKKEEGQKPKLARIYAFTYEGSFYNLPKPAVYLVHGPGKEIVGPAGETKWGVSASGLVARDLAFEQGVRYWEYDKGDFTLRCDIVSGTFEEVLLDAALSMTARDALISRSDLAARSDLAGRSDVTSRSDLAVRHRLKE